MDYNGTFFADSLIPSFLDNVAVVDDKYRDVAASVDENANFTGLAIIEGSSSIVAVDLQEGNAEGLAPVKSSLNPTSLFDELRELWVGEPSSRIEQCIDTIWMPQERNELQSFPVDLVAANFGESVPCLDRPEADPVHYQANMDVEYNYESSSRRAQFPHMESGCHKIHSEEDQHEFFACVLCGNLSTSQIVRPCGHVICQPSCIQTWSLDEGHACPYCWYICGGGSEVMDIKNNLECRTDFDELVPIPEEYLLCLAPPRDLDITGYCGRTEMEELDQAVQEPYQLLLQEAERESLQEIFPVQTVAEVVQFLLMPVEEISPTPKQSNGGRKRGRETLVVDHNGIAMRYDGCEERFTAYYRPSYWTEDDSSVFLGEYPTHEEAADAHNLVALLHEGSDAQLILPHTAERYTNELRRWGGRHHVDLVCELRLRGRGLLKDGGVNYKHVGRRWSGKKKGTRYFSTVSDDLVSSSNGLVSSSNGLVSSSNGLVSSSDAKTSKVAKRTFLNTFDTAEQAAQYADHILVKRKGVEAWTNFPLSSYIPSKDLPLSFLPISNNFRDNLTYKRTKA